MDVLLLWAAVVGGGENGKIIVLPGTVCRLYGGPAAESSHQIGVSDFENSNRTEQSKRSQPDKACQWVTLISSTSNNFAT